MGVSTKKANQVFNLHHGSSFFWRTQQTLIIDIYQHTEFDVLEVCAYEPTSKREAPRLFLGNSKVVAVLNKSLIAAEADHNTEMACRQRIVHDNAKIWTDALNKAKVNFVLSHLIIVEGISDLLVDFFFPASSFPDDESDKKDRYTFVCAKPPSLVCSTTLQPHSSV